jgi:restriction system protein
MGGAMAEITRQRTGEMVREVLKVLCDQPDGLEARKVLAAVETRLGLTDFERSDYPTSPGVRRFEKILRFSTIPAVKAGWLVKAKGTWTITDEGRAALDKFTDPAEFMRESVRRYRAWKKDQPDESLVDVEGADETEVIATSDLEEASESAWDGIRQFVRAMNAYDFQDLAAALLEAMGYNVAWNAPPGPDQGLDILAYRDPLGTEDPRIKVQVKQRPDSKTTPDGIRSFMAILGSSDVGIFISTGGFTPEARREARNQESRRVTLVDLDRFIELWIEHYESVAETKRLLLPLKPVWFLSPPT